eukprot:359159-Chlamydomonas_euryale.AAC.26
MMKKRVARLVLALRYGAGHLCIPAGVPGLGIASYPMPMRSHGCDRVLRARCCVHPSTVLRASKHSAALRRHYPCNQHPKAVECDRQPKFSCFACLIACGRCMLQCAAPWPGNPILIRRWASSICESPVPCCAAIKRHPIFTTIMHVCILTVGAIVAGCPWRACTLLLCGISGVSMWVRSGAERGPQRHGVAVRDTARAGLDASWGSPGGGEDIRRRWKSPDPPS